jgi:hypothetical protein
LFHFSFFIFHFLFFTKTTYTILSKDGGEAPEKDVFKEFLENINIVYFSYFIFYKNNIYYSFKGRVHGGFAPEKDVFKEFLENINIVYFSFFIFHKNKIYYSFKGRVHGGFAPEKDGFKEPLIDFSFFKETTKIDLLFYKILK